MKALGSPELALTAIQAGLLASNNQRAKLEGSAKDISLLRETALRLEVPTKNTGTENEPKSTLSDALKALMPSTT